jgi:hypothetical protein
MWTSSTFELVLGRSPVYLRCGVCGGGFAVYQPTSLSSLVVLFDLANINIRRVEKKNLFR